MWRYIPPSLLDRHLPESTLLCFVRARPFLSYAQPVFPYLEPALYDHTIPIITILAVAAAVAAAAAILTVTGTLHAPMAFLRTAAQRSKFTLQLYLAVMGGAFLTVAAPTLFPCPAGQGKGKRKEEGPMTVMRTLGAIISSADK